MVVNNQNPTSKKGVGFSSVRFPGLNQENQNKIAERTANFKGAEKKVAEQKLYSQLYKKQKLNEQTEERWNTSAEVMQMGIDAKDKTQGDSLTLQSKNTDLATIIRQKYGITKGNDSDIVRDFVSQIPNGDTLYRQYMNGENSDLLTRGKLVNDKGEFYKTAGKSFANIRKEVSYDPVQGGAKALVNKPSQNIFQNEKELAEGQNILDNILDIINPVGEVSEVLDNTAQYIPTFTYEGQVENLSNRIADLTDEEIQAYRERYNELMKDKDWRFGRVQGDTIIEQLWNAAKGNIDYSSTDAGFEDWLISQNANLWESLTGADDTLKGVNSPNVIKFFSNIPGSAVKTFTATLRGMTNPIDTAKGLYELITTEEGQQALLERYGSWDAIANTMNTDPVGLADDLVTIGEAGVGLTKLGAKTAAKTSVKAANKMLKNSRLSQKMINAVNNMSDFSKRISETQFGNVNDVLVQKTKLPEYSGLGLVGKGAAKISNLKNGEQAPKTIQEKVKEPSVVSKLMQTTADQLITNANRITKGQQAEFYKKYGTTMGQYMNDRGFKNAMDVVKYFIENKGKVDTAMEEITGKFNSPILTEIIEDLTEHAKATSPRSNQSKVTKYQEILKRANEEGLTMSEINEIKRDYEKNIKYAENSQNKASDKVQLETNKDDELRAWQFKLAEENGFTNLAEMNKETQMAKFISDKIIDWEKGSIGNNAISLTDWIVLGNMTNPVELTKYVSKKALTSKWFQRFGADILNKLTGREKKTFDVNMNKIGDANTSKDIQKAELLNQFTQLETESDFDAWVDGAINKFDEIGATKEANEMRELKAYIAEEGFNKESTAGSARYQLADGVDEKNRWDMSKEEQKMSIDSEGELLSKEQQNKFKNSKVRDSDGYLMPVYHTMTTAGDQFNEFDPRGSEGYKYGDDIVNFYTDSQDMSASYANGKYKNAIDVKTDTVEGFKEYLKRLGEVGDKQKNLDLKKDKDGRYVVVDMGEFNEAMSRRKSIIKDFEDSGMTLDDIRNFRDKYKEAEKLRGLNNYDKPMSEFMKKVGVTNEDLLWLSDNISYDNLMDIKYIDEEFPGLSRAMTFTDEADMLKNGPKQVQYLVYDNEFQSIMGFRGDLDYEADQGRYQYKGYLNIENPYIIEGNGKNWDMLEKGGYEDVIKEIKDNVNGLDGKGKEEFESLAYRAYNNLYSNEYSFGDTNYKKFFEENDEFKPVYDVIPESVKKAIDNSEGYSDEKFEKFMGVLNAIKNGYDDEALGDALIRAGVGNASETNDIVKKVLEMNKNGANYDGVIFKDVVDYGGYSEDRSPHNVYVSFGSEQFKGVNNKTPTDSKDWRYQEVGVANSKEKTITAEEGLNMKDFKNGKTVKDRLVELGIQDKVANGLVDGIAYGKYDKGIIELAQQIKEGTAPHELLHGAFDLVDETRKKTILQGVQKRTGLDKVKAEEWLADNFSEYYRTGKFDTKDFGTGFVGTIKKFFNQVKEFLDGTYANRKEIKKLFDDILDGEELGNSSPLGESRYQTMTDKEYMKYVNKGLKEIGKGQHGTIYTGLKGNTAIAFLLGKQDGEMKGAFNYGGSPIDIAWTGWKYGVKKIYQKHPEALWQIQKMIDDRLGSNKNHYEGQNKYVLEDSEGKVVFTLDWDGEDQKMLITAYKLKP